MMNGYEQLTIWGEGVKMEPDYSGDTNAAKGARLRERQEKDFHLDGFNDGEVLQLLITNVYTGSRYDAAEMAARLLDMFGSLKGVFEARPEQLAQVPGVNRRIASMIGQVIPLVRAWNRAAMTEADRVGNSRDAEAYCKSLLEGERIEKFYVISLNAQCKILGRRMISEGSLSEVSAYPRMVTETALNYNAHSILLCHNHPGGTCAPSAEDIASTVQLQRILQGLGILVLDHIIVAGSNTYSMIQHGDIDYRIRNR